jgi:hypothetical protein
VNDWPIQQGEFFWQTGYVAIAAMKSQLPAVRDYLFKQTSHHRGERFKEELFALLHRHNTVASRLLGHRLAKQPRNLTLPRSPYTERHCVDGGQDDDL